MNKFSYELIELGIKEIDEQHKKILKMIVELGENKNSINIKEILQHILIEMEEYSIKHFTYEERLMKNSGYKEIDNHKLLHDKYKEKVMEYNIRIRDNNDIKTEEIISWLWEWWINHIQVSDRIWANDYKEKNGLTTGSTMMSSILCKPVKPILQIRRNS